MSKNSWIWLIYIVSSTAGISCAADSQTSGNDKDYDTIVTNDCPDDSERYTTSSGEIICCPENVSQFCDENSHGYTGGCWRKETDCNTITECGGVWVSCPIGSLPYCDENSQLQCHVCLEGSTVYETTSGVPICCSAQAATFCDETDQGYPGGCWETGVDCGTISLCGGEWVACGIGMVVICDEVNHICSAAL